MQNSNKIDLERGRTSADRTHSFTFSGICVMDYFGNSSPVVKALLNDWTVSAIVTLQSGTPLTITSGLDRNFDGLTNDRADINGDPEARQRPSARGADRAVVQHRGVLAAGDRQRRQLAAAASSTARAIATSISACSATSAWSARRGSRCASRRPTCSTSSTCMNPGTNLNAPATFGKIRSARDMRRIQLGARVSF